LVAISHSVGKTDAKIILKHFAPRQLKKVIARGSDKFLSITLEGLRFIDSSEFLGSEGTEIFDCLLEKYENTSLVLLKFLAKDLKIIKTSSPCVEVFCFHTINC